VNKKLFLCTVLLLGSFSLLFPKDTQLWNTVTFATAASKNIRAQYANELRYRENIGNFFYYHIEPLFLHRLFDEHFLGAQYRIAFSKDSLANWQREIRPGLVMTNKFSVGSAHDFYTRFKLVYKFKDRGRENHELFRALLGFTFLKKKWVNIYMANEFFWNDTNTHTYDQNRLSVGIKGKFSKEVGWGIYYLHKEDKAGPGDWRGTHVFGLQLSANI